MVNGLRIAVWCENYGKKGSKKEGNEKKVAFLTAGGKRPPLSVLSSLFNFAVGCVRYKRFALLMCSALMEYGLMWQTGFVGDVL